MTRLAINFDMDGTIADLYGVENWLEDIINENTRPYEIARPLVRLATLARLLNKLQNKGYEINIISWLAKSGKDDYNKRITEAKKAWLKNHLPSVKWDNIYIVAYGTPKETLGNGILFDDEKPNRDNWNGTAYNVHNILEVLRNL